jgi:hypothetical protein
LLLALPFFAVFLTADFAFFAFFAFFAICSPYAAPKGSSNVAHVNHY